MAVTLKVKCSDGAVRVQREGVAQRVLSYFGDSLPASRLLCFLDDEDPSLLRRWHSPANRGLYEPIHDKTPMAAWPDYVTDHVLVDDGINWGLERVTDDLIYLYGTTCANEVGLTMTLAHELQHAIQHANVRKLWAVNALVPNLDRPITDSLKLTWADIPIERETRIVSKNVAVELFGEQRVREYIDQKIAEHVTEGDAADWRFVATLTSSSTVDLDADTRQLFGRLRSYRGELEKLLQEKRSAKNPDFLDIDLASYF